jgi:hypothetical protein
MMGFFVVVFWRKLFFRYVMVFIPVRNCANWAVSFIVYGFEPMAQHFNIL